MVLTLVALGAIGLAQGGAIISPLQSPVDTPQLVPTRPPPTPSPQSNTATPTPSVEPTITLTPTPGPSPTPDTQATSQSVIATITALAATPTYPPTDTPRPRRTPIISGPGDVAAQPGSTDITVQTMSEQVFAGGTAVLTIRTQPGARCVVQIVRDDAGVASLEPIADAPAQTAGSNGLAAWIWTVDRDEPAGIMRLHIDCATAGAIEVRMRVAAE